MLTSDLWYSPYFPGVRKGARDSGGDPLSFLTKDTKTGSYPAAILP